ncbi:TPA: ica operon transcriptional regulator IcaR, partial [Staphylococcus aureus]|nr:ica operon transcriptional regulator IcaR [Staphylococcus aureus]
MKDKIIDNAITLFSEKGYDGTTLDDIAKSVNIKKASLYYHFDSKKSIY